MMTRQSRFAFALILCPVLVLACGDDAAEPAEQPGAAGTGGSAGKGGSAAKGGSSAAKGGSSAAKGGSSSGKGGTGGDGESGMGGKGGKGGKGGAAGKGGSDAEGGAGGEPSAGAGGTEAGGKAGTSAGSAGAAGAAGQDAGGTAGSGGAAGSGETAGSGGATAGSGGADGGDPTKTRLRFVVLSEAVRNTPLDICYGQNLTNPNGDDDGYHGPVAKAFAESIVSPQVTRYVSNDAATPLLGGVPIVIRVVKALTDCKKANRLVGTNDDITASLVAGAENTILLVDTPNNGKTLQAKVLTDVVSPPASAIVHLFGGVYQKGIELYGKGPNDATKLLGSADYGKPTDVTLAAGTAHANLVIATTGDVATGIVLPGMTFASGTTYSALGAGLAAGGKMFASVCADDKAVPSNGNYIVKACTFTPNPADGN